MSRRNRINFRWLYGHRLSNLLKSQEQVINGERPVEYAISRGRKFDDMMASKKFNTVRRGR